MNDPQIRAALERHWAASAAGDQAAEHEIYHDDAIVRYPQSGECIRGRHNAQALRSQHPARPSGLMSLNLPALGVVVGIAPFNFPALIPLWMSAVVFTKSER